MKKIYLASSPGCVKDHAKEQEKFIAGMKANRMYSFWTLKNQIVERMRFRITAKSRGRK